MNFQFPFYRYSRTSFTLVIIFFCSITLSRSQSFTDTLFLVHQFEVLFPFDEFELDHVAKEQINNSIDSVSNREIYRIVLEGHTDWIGSEMYNMKLSQQRVENVAALFVGLGILPNRVDISWKGESMPKASNETDEGRQQNRRVTVEIYVPTNKTTRVEPYLFGKVTDAENGQALLAELEFQLVTSDNFEGTIRSNSNGEYKYMPASWTGIFINCFSKGYIYQTLFVDLENEEPGIREINFELQKVRKGSVFVAENIYFFPDEDVVLPTSLTAIERLLNFMHENPTVHIEIQGHVNWPSTYFISIPKNVELLSELRAKAVFTYLMSHEIEEFRLSYKGMSNTQMVFPDAINEEEYRKNMRVEIVITKE